MVGKTQNIAKWVVAVASVIAIACVLGFVKTMSTTYICPVTDHPCSTQSPHTEIDVLPNLTNNVGQQNPSHPTPSTGIFGSPTYDSDETRTNTSLNIKGRIGKSINLKTEESQDSEKAVNEIKSKIRNILSAIVSHETNPITKWRINIAKYMILETRTNTWLNIKGRMGKLNNDKTEESQYSVNAVNVIKSKVRNILLAFVSYETNPITKWKITIAKFMILETRTNTSLNIKGRIGKLTNDKTEESQDSERAVNEIKSKIRNILSAIVSHETMAITKWKICNTAKYITLAAFAVKAVACVIIIILMYPLTESTPENEILSEQSFKLKKTEP